MVQVSGLGLLTEFIIAPRHCRTRVCKINCLMKKKKAKAQAEKFFIYNRLFINFLNSINYVTKSIWFQYSTCVRSSATETVVALLNANGFCVDILLAWLALSYSVSGNIVVKRQFPRLGLLSLCRVTSSDKNEGCFFKEYIPRYG